MRKFVRFGFLVILGIITACGGGGGGSSTNTSTSGINSIPSNFYANLNYNRIDLSWSLSTSTNADSLRIVRASYDSTGKVGTYIQIADLSVSTTAYVDTQIQEFTKYNYRLCYVRNNIGGPYVSADTFYIGLFPPINLTITAGTNQATLSWSNISTHAKNVVINRLFTHGDQGAYWSQIASIPSSSSSYVDSNILSGFYTYSLSASDGTNISSESKAYTWVLDQENPLHLISQVINPPEIGNRWWARNPAGNWVILNELGSIYIPIDGNSWNKINLPNTISGYAEPGIRLDSSGLPHIIYYTRTGTSIGSYTIIHAWYDGAQWKTGEIATRTLLMTSGVSIIGFDVSPSGSVHVFWQLGDVPVGSHIEYATNESGHWIISSISSPLVDLGNSSVRLATINIASDGTTYLTLPLITAGVGNQILILSHQPNQSWTEEIVPLSPAQVMTTDPVLMLPVDKISFELLYYQNESNNLYTDLTHLSKNSGGWAQPDVLISRGFSGYMPKIWGTTTKDGSRTAACVAVPAPGFLSNNLESSHLVFTRDTGQLWTRTTLTNNGRSEVEVDYFLCFDKLNKMHLLNTQTCTVFNEQ